MNFRYIHSDHSLTLTLVLVTCLLLLNTLLIYTLSKRFLFIYANQAYTYINIIIAFWSSLYSDATNLV